MEVQIWVALSMIAPFPFQRKAFAWHSSGMLLVEFCLFSITTYNFFLNPLGKFMGYWWSSFLLLWHSLHSSSIIQPWNSTLVDILRCNGLHWLWPLSSSLFWLVAVISVDAGHWTSSSWDSSHFVKALCLDLWLHTTRYVFKLVFYCVV